MAEEKKAALLLLRQAEGQVHRMIQGPGVRICDECVQLCMSILDDGYSAAMDEGFERGGSAHAAADQGGAGSVCHRSGGAKIALVRVGV